VDLMAYLESRQRMIGEALEAALPEMGGLAGDLRRAMRYSLLAGGKRLRPVLCLAGAEAVGGAVEQALPAALALEMVHTYSLIHDDLPCMDDDDFRRGRPTSHKVFGEALAVLAGDGLLAEGLAILVRAGAEGRWPADRVLAALNEITRALSSEGMVAGQVVDLQMEGREADEATVRFIHTHKTGALIAASVTSGALLAGGRPEQVRALGCYGRSVGLAFQIVDDILDIEGDPEVMGKGRGADQALGKVTYPGVIGLEPSWETARNLVAEGRAALAGFGPEADPLRDIAAYFLTRQK
jgi:geranylgeranyl diphosphate synthase type II